MRESVSSGGAALEGLRAGEGTSEGSFPPAHLAGHYPWTCDVFIHCRNLARFRDRPPLPARPHPYLHRAHHWQGKCPWGNTLAQALLVPMRCLPALPGPCHTISNPHAFVLCIWSPRLFLLVAQVKAVEEPAGTQLCGLLEGLRMQAQAVGVQGSRGTPKDGV